MSEPRHEDQQADETTPGQANDGRLLPQRPAAPPPPAAPPRRPGCSFLGWALIAIGLLLLARNLGWISSLDLSTWWPVLLMVAGLSLIGRALRR